MSVFSKIQKTKVPSNIFDLTHDKKLSGKMGRLIPIMVMDCVPGDKVKINSSVMVRFAPMIAPVMHRVSVYLHFFFVPNRILWKNWENFITGGEDGYDVSVAPYLEPLDTPNGIAPGTLGDYMGLPTGVRSKQKISALPFAAYQKIYNDYYRDQNLGATVDTDLVDGDNDGKGLVFIRNRAWQHDYFTSALPWTQKGPEALLPLGDRAPIVFGPPQPSSYAGQNIRNAFSPNEIIEDAPDSDLYKHHTGRLYIKEDADGAPMEVALDLNESHYTDLSGATASSINDLRKAFKLQEWLEKNARGGSRYIESIYVHFGVNSSDQRLQRPKFLGGMSAPVKISEVLQTAPPTQEGNSPQANMAGHGISVGSGGNIGHYCEEHGYIIGIMSIMPTSAYQQGIPRHFSRFDKFDYYWPEFAHIGEQPILQKELYLSEIEENNEAVFGYTPRYAEYKYVNNTVHGDFRDQFDFWHMGRKFASPPALNSDFIKMDNSEVSRIFAVEGSYDNLWCHVLNTVKADRKMPVFGTPKF